MPDFHPQDNDTCFDANAVDIRNDPDKISSGAAAGAGYIGRARSGTRLAAVDCACLHDEGDVFEHVDVFQGIAGHGYDVGVVAGLQDADLVLPVE
jgi:hypothetical protein